MRLILALVGFPRKVFFVPEGPSIYFIRSHPLCIFKEWWSLACLVDAENIFTARHHLPADLVTGENDNNRETTPLISLDVILDFSFAAVCGDRM